MTTRQTVESPYAPRDQFYDFHARWQRFAIMVCHRRAGKTVACINDLVDKACQSQLPMPRYSYVAPFYKMAKDIAWAYLKFYAAPLIEKIMETELSVVLKPNGAVVRLYGADNPDALRGVYNDGVVMDEYGLMSPRIFGEVIAPTLTDRKGWVVFIGTPAGPNHFYDLWQKAQNDPNWFTMMLRADESGILDEEELRLMSELPGSDEETFRQEFYCDFYAAIRGAYYGKQLNDLEGMGHMGSFPYDPERNVLTAWDIGYSDDTSIWFFQTDGRRIHVIDFFTGSGWSVGDIVGGVLSQRPYTYGPLYLPHDAKNKSFQTGKSTRELLIEAGATTMIVPNLSVQDGIQAVRKTLPTIWFNTDNADVLTGVNALKVYQREWDDKKQIFRDVPKHDWASNPADAMRMLALAMNPAAARTAARTLNATRKATTTPPTNVLNLENLYRDRTKRGGGRI